MRMHMIMSQWIKNLFKFIRQITGLRSLLTPSRVFLQSFHIKIFLFFFLVISDMRIYLQQHDLRVDKESSTRHYFSVSSKFVIFLLNRNLSWLSFVVVKNSLEILFLGRISSRIHVWDWKTFFLLFKQVLSIVESFPIRLFIIWR